MRIEKTSPVALRHGLHGPEIDHIERADRPDIGRAAAGDRSEAVFSRAQDAIAQEIANLGCRHVDKPVELTAVEQLLHSAAAGSRRMKHHAIVAAFQSLDGLRHARRRDAEHCEADRGLVAAWRRLGRARHSCDRISGIAEDDAAYTIEAGKIGDRGHHRDVGHVDVGSDVSRSERRNDEFRQADRKGPHTTRDDRGAAASADAEDGVELGERSEEPLESLPHPGDRKAAVSSLEDRGVETRRDLAACHIHRALRLADADIDHDRMAAGLGDLRSQITELLALGVSRADDQDAFHGALPHGHWPRSAVAAALRNESMIVIMRSGRGMSSAQDRAAGEENFDNDIR